MIDKTPIPGLDLNNTEAKAQINNFWNYLDELASKNPEEYKKFIKAQMQKGLSMAESMKKEQAQQQSQNNPNKTNINPNINNEQILSEIYSKNILTKKEFKVFPFMCLEFRPTKIIKKNFDMDEINNSKNNKDINNDIILRDINTNIQNEVKEIKNSK